MTLSSAEKYSSTCPWRFPTVKEDIIYPEFQEQITAVRPSKDIIQPSTNEYSLDTTDSPAGMFWNCDNFIQVLLLTKRWKTIAAIQLLILNLFYPDIVNTMTEFWDWLALHIVPIKPI